MGGRRLVFFQARGVLFEQRFFPQLVGQDVLELLLLFSFPLLLLLLLLPLLLLPRFPLPVYLQESMLERQISEWNGQDK